MTYKYRLISVIRGIKYPTYHKTTDGVAFKEMENIAYFMQHCQQIGCKCTWTLKALHKNMDMDAVCERKILLTILGSTYFRIDI
jgi:hypothetical protein